MQEKIKTNAGQLKTKLTSAGAKLSETDFSKVKNLKPQSSKGTALFFGIILVIVFVSTIGLTRVFLNQSDNKNDRIDAPVALASQDLATSFEFPIRDQNNEEVAKVRYEIEKANLQNEFIYQGKLAKSIQGRTFLVFDLKITNPYEKGIEINTIDYIRVKRNGSDEQLAPEIHNDPVQVQANSTKYTRIGLPINESDKNLMILVGELQGEKEEVKLNF